MSMSCDTKLNYVLRFLRKIGFLPVMRFINHVIIYVLKVMKRWLYFLHTYGAFMKHCLKF
jgi:hypothetical protein